MEERLQNSENYLQCLVKHSPVEGASRDATSVGGGSCTKGKGEMYERCDSPEDEDYETFLEQGSMSPTSGDEDSTDDSSSHEVDGEARPGDTDDSTDDDDRGGDFTVSKYMQSKMSRLDEARFGVWRVEKLVTRTGPDNGTAADSSVGVGTGPREVAGTSHSPPHGGLPPLKLTLKKSQQGNGPDEIPPKEKIPKKKHKTKRCSSEAKEPHKRRPGRPPTSNPPPVSTRQRLMNLFKKKYFKDRKRWARTKSSYSMPPTIRSIAKP